MKSFDVFFLCYSSLRTHRVTRHTCSVLLFYLFSSVCEISANALHEQIGKTLVAKTVQVEKFLICIRYNHYYTLVFKCIYSKVSLKVSYKHNVCFYGSHWTWGGHTGHVISKSRFKR